MRTSILVTILALTFVGCGGSKKAGGAKNATSAQTSKGSQKTGSAATGGQSSATAQGSTKDGVTCDASLNGVGFCASESSIVFCSGGSWYALDCSDIEDGAYCGQDGDTIDCYVD